MKICPSYCPITSFYTQLLSIWGKHFRVVLPIFIFFILFLLFPYEYISLTFFSFTFLFLFIVRDHCHRQRSEGVDVNARRKLIIASGLCLFFMICEIVGKYQKPPKPWELTTSPSHQLTPISRPINRPKICYYSWLAFAFLYRPSSRSIPQPRSKTI